MPQSIQSQRLPLPAVKSQADVPQQAIIPLQAPYVPVQQTRIKLPKVELKSFHGEETKWKAFWDMFEAAVHHQELADVEKSTYLQGLLKGDAARIINGLELTNANYSVAITMLLNRYNQTRVSKQTLYQRLEKLQCPTARIQDQQTTLEEVESVLRQLTSINEDIAQPALIRLVLHKFPLATITKMEEMRNTEDDWTMPELRHYLARAISTRNRAIISAGIKEEKFIPQGRHNNQATRGNRGGYRGTRRYQTIGRGSMNPTSSLTSGNVPGKVTKQSMSVQKGLMHSICV